jgi:hypothetical protein
MIDEVAREINAEPWEPPPAMVKLRCAAVPLLVRCG